MNIFTDLNFKLTVYTTTTVSPHIYRNYAFCAQRTSMGARDISLSCMWSSLISLLAIFFVNYTKLSRDAHLLSL